MSLLQTIRQQIEQQEEKSTSYYQYMQLALYHPEEGYYSQSKQKIGKEGDFFTSASVGSVFGEVLGSVFAEMLEEQKDTKPRYLVEFGGGTGDLTYQILNEWRENFPYLLDRIQVIMIEKSPFHRELQQKKLEGLRVDWVDSWSSLTQREGKINGVVFSNELLDAFPVFVLEYQQGKWREVRVAWDSDASQLVEVQQDISCPDLLKYIQLEGDKIPKISGYRVEVNLDAVQWLKDIIQGLDQGYLTTIDYGYRREELYLPHRKAGTMRCYYQHVATDNPLDQPGEKDITTHVHFSYLMETGEEHGLKNLGLYSQSQFLINGGILTRLVDHQESDPFQGTHSKRNRAIRQLIMPGGMGDTFKVLVQAKGTVKEDLECLRPKGWM